MYEAPYNDDEAARQAWKAYRKQLADVLAHGRRGDALVLFMLLVGMPPQHLDAARAHPLWPMWEAAAATLAYDAAVMGEDASIPTEKAARVAAPTLVMDGEASFPFMHVTARRWQTPFSMPSIAPCQASPTRSKRPCLLPCWWSFSLPTEPEGMGP